MRSYLKRFIKKFILWTLIVLFVFTNILAGFIKADKAKAGHDDKNKTIIFDEPTPGFGHTPTEITATAGTNNIHITWMSDLVTYYKDSDPPRPLSVLDAFVIQVGQSYMLDCYQGVGGGWTLATFSDHVQGSSVTQKDNKFEASIPTVQITPPLQTGDKIFIQSKWVGAPGAYNNNVSYSSRGFGVYTGTTDTDTEEGTDVDLLMKSLNPEIVNAYVANKLKPYEKSGKDEPGTGSDWRGTAGLATSTDRENFKSFMSLFDGTDPDWKNAIINLETNRDIDPWKSAGFVGDDGKWYTLLDLTLDIQPLYLKYYTQYTGGPNDFKTKIDDLNKQINDFMDENIEGSCTDIVNRLNSDIQWQHLFANIGGAVGAALSFWFKGGLKTAAVAAAGGYAVGGTIDNYFQAGELTELDKKIIEFTKKTWVLYYAILYMEYKEARIGLIEYYKLGKKKDDPKTGLDQDTGMNPAKAKVLNDADIALEATWEVCDEAFKKLMGIYKGNDNCGIPMGSVHPSDMIGTALCSLIGLMANIAEGLVRALFTTVFDARAPAPQTIGSNFSLAALTAPFQISTAHAGGEFKPVSPLVASFTVNGGGWPWVIPSWKFCLGLTNLFLVVILLFIGIVNILHIQYDTYQIKKALPLIIISVILANFSLLIMRMLLDAANILTNTFAGGGSPTDLVGDLITNAHVGDVSGFTGSLSLIAGLLVAFFFSFFALVAFLILGFMFYIRYAAIILLGIVAPLAFVAMAFPPTQSLFKQWWSWTTKMIFMKPIAFFILMLAANIKGNESAVTDLTAWIIVIALVYFAILVPWKLGGAVTAFWGGVGGTFFGTKKGGWARKPVEEWWQRRKDKAAHTARALAPGLFKGAEKDREEVEALKRIGDARVKEKARDGGRVTQLEDMALEAENELKKKINDQMDAVGSAQIKMPLLLRIIAKTDALGQAGKSTKRAADAALSQKNIEKKTEDTTNLAALQIGKKNNELRADLEEYLADGDGIVMQNIVDGRLVDEETTDKDGKKVTRLGTYADVMNRAEHLDQRAAQAEAAGDHEGALALKEGANEQRRKAGEWARSHTKTKDGRTMNYEDFEDELYNGRVLSLTTNWTIEDSQIESTNTPPEKLIEQLLETGGGDRLMKAAAPVLKQILSGKRRGMSVTDLRVWERLMTTLQMQIGRGSPADRATAMGGFLEALSQRKFYGADSYGGTNKLGEELNKFAMLISENPDLPRGVVAEQILAARRRGTTLKGMEAVDLGNQQWTKENVSAKLKELEEAGTINTSKYLVENPSVISQIGSGAPGISMQDSNNYLAYIADGANRLKLLGGGGNPNNNILAGKDISEENRFSELRVKEKKDIKKIQEEVKEKETRNQEATRQSEELSQTPANNYSQGIESRAVGGEDMMKLIQRYQGGILLALRNIPKLLGGIKLNGAAIDDADIERIGQIIASSTANNLQDLAAEIAGQIGGLEITLPEGVSNDAEGLNGYRQELSQLLTGIQNAQVLGDAARAQESAKYAPVTSNKDIAGLKAELAELKEALGNFSRIMQNLDSTGQSMNSFPKETLEKIATLIADKSAVVPLRDDVLRSDPAQAGEILKKMTKGWLGVIKAKEAGQDVSQEMVLRQILAEERRQRNENARDRAESDNRDRTNVPPPSGGNSNSRANTSTPPPSGNSTNPPRAADESVPPPSS